jgi:hypothetical protein
MTKKVFIQVQADERERQQLLEIAKSRGVSMSAQVRQWIRIAHKPEMVGK